MKRKKKLTINERINLHFEKYKRPKMFINKGHCQECEEHYRTLEGVERYSLQYKHFEKIGWDPSCFLVPEAFKYYFPGMVKIVEDCPDEDWLERFLSRLFGYQTDTFTEYEWELVLELLIHWLGQKQKYKEDLKEIQKTINRIKNGEHLLERDKRKIEMEND